VGQGKGPPYQCLLHPFLVLPHFVADPLPRCPAKDHPKSGVVYGGSKNRIVSGARERPPLQCFSTPSSSFHTLWLIRCRAAGKGSPEEWGCVWGL